MDVEVRLGCDPRHDNPIRRACDVLRRSVPVRVAAEHRLVQGTDRRHRHELAGDFLHSVEAVLRVLVPVRERLAERDQTVPADEERAPLLIGEVEHEALKPDLLSVGDRYADVLFPGHGLDRTRVAAVPVWREDQGQAVQVEQVGRGCVLGRQFHEDLVVWSGRYPSRLIQPRRVRPERSPKRWRTRIIKNYDIRMVVFV